MENTLIRTVEELCRAELPVELHFLSQAVCKIMELHMDLWKDKLYNYIIYCVCSYNKFYII